MTFQPTVTKFLRSYANVVLRRNPVDPRQSKLGASLLLSPVRGDDLSILDMVAEEVYNDQRLVLSNGTDSLSDYKDAMQELELDTAPEAREYLLNVLGVSPTEADEALTRASVPSAKHHAYYTNHKQPWIQIKMSKSSQQHARAKRGPPQVAGEQAGTNHSQVPYAGLYATRMNNTKFPVGVGSIMYNHLKTRADQTTPHNRIRSRAKKWQRSKINGKWTKVPIKQCVPKKLDRPQEVGR